MNTYHIWDNGWTPCKHTEAAVGKLVCSGWCPRCLAELHVQHVNFPEMPGIPTQDELDDINGIENVRTSRLQS
jgi:hypothetical protein